MTARIRVGLLAVIGVVVPIAVLMFHYKERKTYTCQDCFAQKDVFQWRVGSWPGLSVPLTPSWVRIRETRFQQDFSPAGHVHNWMFAQGSPYYFFGRTWGGCALGAGRHVSELSQMYESSPEFRTFITEKLKDGSLAKSNVVALISLDPIGEPSPLKKDADALLRTFFAR